jgi:hypothetical protein
MTDPVHVDFSEAGLPAADGDFYLMRGSYDHHVARTADGWKITKVVQHVSRLEGNPDALQPA